MRLVNYSLPWLLLIIASSVASADPVKVWEDIYDGGGAHTDTGSSALTASDGHLIVGGITTSRYGDVGTYVSKLDSQTGELIWMHNYISPDDNPMTFTDIFEDNDGNILAGAYTQACVG